MIDHVSIRSAVPLAPLTTYKVGGPARWFCEPTDLEELRSVLELVPTGATVVVLGRGSNVLISDAGIDGLVIRLGGAFGAIDATMENRVVAGAACALPKLARVAQSAGRTGLEFYVGIPGSVGGAVRMNAGGHGSDTASVLVEAVVVDLGTGSVTLRSPEELGLSYRHSDLTDSEIVVQATFETADGDPSEIAEMLLQITRWRKENQPGGTLNAGSVFKNPQAESAGAIIDRCGLKGVAIGPVQVSPVHANFLVAAPEATANDIHDAVIEIRSTVLELTGIRLEPEIRFLGAFASGGGGA